MADTINPFLSNFLLQTLCLHKNKIIADTIKPINKDISSTHKNSWYLTFKKARHASLLYGPVGHDVDMRFNILTSIPKVRTTS